MQEWRNWQTRRLQVPVVARSCGFKSHLLHSFLFQVHIKPLHYFFALRIKNWSGGPIRIALMGSVKTFRQGIFIFPEKKIIPTGHFMPNTHFKSIPEKKFP